jgi:hypothetical protein
VVGCAVNTNFAVSWSLFSVTIRLDGSPGLASACNSSFTVSNSSTQTRGQSNTLAWAPSSVYILIVIVCICTPLLLNCYSRDHTQVTILSEMLHVHAGVISYSCRSGTTKAPTNAYSLRWVVMQLSRCLTSKLCYRSQRVWRRLMRLARLVWDVAGASNRHPLPPGRAEGKNSFTCVMWLW